MGSAQLSSILLVCYYCILKIGVKAVADGKAISLAVIDFYRRDEPALALCSSSQAQDCCSGLNLTFWLNGFEIEG